MEKLIYLLWRAPGSAAEAFAHTVRGALAEAVAALPGVRRVQANVQDAEVAPAAGIRQTRLDPAIDALLQVWVDTAVDAFRAPLDAVIAARTARHAAYRVCESEPLVNTRHAPRPGQRTAGFAQIAVLRQPARLTRAEWLAHWQNVHTRVAIDTQDTFEYRQNLVVQTLTAGAPAVDAIVEECFPAAAMNDPFAFFAAAGDEAKFREHLRLMMDSVDGFLERGQIDVLPTSQYLLKA